MSQYAYIAQSLIATTALYGALGVCAGALFANLSAAVGVVLVWLLKGEELLAGALGQWWDIGDWLPAALGEGLVRAGAGNPARWAAALALEHAVFEGEIAKLDLVRDHDRAIARAEASAALRMSPPVSRGRSARPPASTPRAAQPRPAKAAATGAPRTAPLPMP